MDNTNLYWSLVSATGMMLVGILAVVYWRLKTGLALRWFWAGVGLWVVAVAVKLLIAIPANPIVFAFLQQNLPHWAVVALGGLYVGLESSLCEIGLTWLAVVRWRQLGENAERAIGVGVGAGAFEAFLLGLLSLGAAAATLKGIENTQAFRDQVDQVTATTPFFWLVASVERIIAILCHVSSRALVLLGCVYQRPAMIFWGFAIFTVLDGIAGAAHLSGLMETVSLWWIELAFLPLALLSIPIIRWCYSRWRSAPAEDAAQF